jgi:hypothetical protein
VNPNGVRLSFLKKINGLLRLAEHLICRTFVELDAVLDIVDGHSRHPTEPAIVLTMAVSVKTRVPFGNRRQSTSRISLRTTLSPTEVNSVAFSTSLPCLSRSDDLPTESSTPERPMAESQRRSHVLLSIAPRTLSMLSIR